MADWIKGKYLKTVQKSFVSNIPLNNREQVTQAELKENNSIANQDLILQ